MNQYLKSASDRFNKIKEKEYLIAPLSNIDCEIIIELGQVLNKFGATAICEILKLYKEEKDEEVRDMLLQWNIDNPKPTALSHFTNAVTEAVEQIVEPDYPPFLEVGDIVIKIYDLKGLQLYERFDEQYGDYKFGIIINPTPPLSKSIPYFSNHTIEYFSEVDRKNILDKLRLTLEAEGVNSIQIT